MSSSTVGCVGHRVGLRGFEPVSAGSALKRQFAFQKHLLLTIAFRTHIAKSEFRAVVFDYAFSSRVGPASLQQCWQMC